MLALENAKLEAIEGADSRHRYGMQRYVKCRVSENVLRVSRDSSAHTAERSALVDRHLQAAPAASGPNRGYCPHTRICSESHWGVNDEQYPPR
jgi:hypothetical protein